MPVFQLSPGTVELRVQNEKVFFWTLQADHASGAGGSGLWGQEIQDNAVENKKEDFHAVIWAPGPWKSESPKPDFSGQSSCRTHQAELHTLLTAARSTELSSLLGSCWERTTRIPEQIMTRKVIESSPASCNVQARLHYNEPTVFLA